MADQAPPLLRPLPRRPFELSSRPVSDAFEPASSSNNSSPVEDDRRDGQTSLTNGTGPHRKSVDEQPELTAASRSRSLLNLTSSTLFGIYSPTNYDSSSQYHPSEPATPWGTGAETPARGSSLDGGRPPYFDLIDGNSRRRSQAGGDAVSRSQSAGRRSGGVLASTSKVVALFVLGVGYGALVSHLYDDRRSSPVGVSRIDASSRAYALFWGTLAVVFGAALPRLDALWQQRSRPSSSYHSSNATRPSHSSSSTTSTNSTTSPSSTSKRRTSHDANKSHRTTTTTTTGDWSMAVRSAGAFVGVAFAARKLPWQSTLQASLTLALANPALWYLLDRTPAGLLLASLAACAGTPALLAVDEAGLVPPPALSGAGAAAATAGGVGGGVLNATAGGAAAVGAAAAAAWSRLAGAAAGSSAADAPLDCVLLGGLVGCERAAVATWLGSVLFCSCICFGNVGRRLGW